MIEAEHQGERLPLNLSLYIPAKQQGRDDKEKCRQQEHYCKTCNELETEGRRWRSCAGLKCSMQSTMGRMWMQIRSATTEETPQEQIEVKAERKENPQHKQKRRGNTTHHGSSIVGTGLQAPASIWCAGGRLSRSPARALHAAMASGVSGCLKRPM